MGSSSPCTCTTRACAYNKMKPSDMVISMGSAESESELNREITNMVKALFNKDNKDAPDIVKNQTAFNKLEQTLKETKIPLGLKISSNCTGFCGAIKDAPCPPPKENYRPSHTKSATHSLVSCIILAIFIIGVSLILWRLSRCSERRQTEVNTDKRQPIKQSLTVNQSTDSVGSPQSTV